VPNCTPAGGAMLRLVKYVETEMLPLIFGLIRSRSGLSSNKAVSLLVFIFRATDENGHSAQTGAGDKPHARKEPVLVHHPRGENFPDVRHTCNRTFRHCGRAGRGVFLLRWKGGVSVSVRDAGPHRRGGAAGGRDVC